MQTMLLLEFVILLKTTFIGQSLAAFVEICGFGAIWICDLQPGKLKKFADLRFGNEPTNLSNLFKLDVIYIIYYIWPQYTS